MRWLMILFALLGLMIGWAFGQEPSSSTARVQVVLKDGRVFHAQVEARSSQQSLWLLWGTPTLQVARPLPWRLVHQVRWQGKHYTAEEFRHLVEVGRVGRVCFGVGLAKTPVGPSRSKAQKKTRPRGTSAWSMAQWAAWTLGTTPPVAHLDAWVRQVASVRGRELVLVLQPRGPAGQEVPVQGTLSVQLEGFRREQGRWVPLERWTRNLTPQSYTPQGAVFRLKIGRASRANWPNLAPYGRLRIRLSVPSQGVVHALVEAVRLPEPQGDFSGPLSQPH